MVNNVTPLAAFKLTCVRLSLVALLTGCVGVGKLGAGCRSSACNNMYILNGSTPSGTSAGMGFAAASATATLNSAPLNFILCKLPIETLFFRDFTHFCTLGIHNRDLSLLVPAPQWWLRFIVRVCSWGLDLQFYSWTVNKEMFP